MAISSELIGSLGASEVTESRFWFTSSAREFSQLDKSWDVPRGNYLFAWQGTLTNIYRSGTNQLYVNGQAFFQADSSGAGTRDVGGYVLLQNVATIALTGDGRKAFEFDPYVAFAKIK